MFVFLCLLYKIVEMDEKYIGISIKNIIIDYLLESSSSDDDDEIFKLLIERKISPRVQNFIENVIHQYSEKEVREIIYFRF